MIKILPNVFHVIDYPQMFQGASLFLIRKENIFSTAYHAIDGGYGTMLQQSSSEDKIPPAGVFAAGAPASFHSPPMLGKKPVADPRGNT